MRLIKLTIALLMISLIITQENLSTKKKTNMDFVRDLTTTDPGLLKFQRECSKHTVTLMLNYYFESQSCFLAKYPGYTCCSYWPNNKGKACVPLDIETAKKKVLEVSDGTWTCYSFNLGIAFSFLVFLISLIIE
jgi:hypothetical protein